MRSARRRGQRGQHGDPQAPTALDELVDEPLGRPAGELPADVRPLAGKARFSADEAAALEAGLRKLLTRP